MHDKKSRVSSLRPAKMGSFFKNSLFMAIGVLEKDATEFQYTCTTVNTVCTCSCEKNTTRRTTMLASDGMQRSEQTTPSPQLVQSLQRSVLVMSSRSPEKYGE
jgi:hypothetical protein